MSHPDVLDAGVIGVKAADGVTELPKAFVVPRKGIDKYSDLRDKEELEQAIVTWVGEQVRHPSRKNTLVATDPGVLTQVSAYKRLSGGCRLVDTIPRRYVRNTDHIICRTLTPSYAILITVHRERYCAVLFGTNENWNNRTWNRNPRSICTTPARQSEVVMSEAQGGLESGKPFSPGFSWNLPRQSLRPRNRHPAS
jgi:hypothetical protein